MLIAGIVLLVLTALFFFITYICFYMAFYVRTKDKKPKEKYSIPDGKEYEPYRDVMINFMKETENIPYKECETVSFDGLKLCGKFYEYEEGAPIELMHHGYRGNAQRDLCGGVLRCFELKRSCLLVDQRGCGDSDGNVISFGINESKDTLKWVDYIIENIDPDAKIILTGISMGASTVIMAAAEKLPENVIGVVADSGFTSAKEIIKKVISDMKLPADLLYPFCKWGAKIYGGFSLEENSPAKALEKLKLPIIFFHGEADDYVPCEMSRKSFENCKAVKTIFTVKGAAHGLPYIVDKEGYMKTVREFEENLWAKRDN